jgi:ATP-dependent Clp protease protease subunit
MKPQNDNNEQEVQFDPFSEFIFESYRELLKDRTILLNSDIDKSIIERLVLPLTTLSEKNSEPIKILINSNGGSVEDGQAAVDAIISSKVTVITVAMGKAMSAAADIFLSGDYRVVYPNSLIMFHSGSSKLDSLTLPQINQEAKLHSEYFKRWSQFYSSRTRISEKEWMERLSSGLNFYYFPEDCLKFGIAHEIIQPITKNIKNLPKFKF